ncbi:glycerol-3-phosphate 1-O-acyltransferase PlsY [Eubacterium sp. AB3007]|uniref:glycerol-3-phosphate 1-O-acyltransferase PlsY n=1 Tax=Eubacterium sp. AB3007 TaxID=1392487 RepID=UPI0004865AF9|nr:glycerol-3-phosphate 1-O-acyltransferase PlsY [Eubacterium sp. AB3007]MBQ1471404.1 glycerol-3-phosphate 1-O-acyltransferase PlsY [Eubacterium sp.]
MMVNGYFILSVVIAYFLGNISPSTIQAKMAGHDIKKEGSGNAGTTNTFRVLGAKAAVITLVIDIAKGVLAVLLGGWLCSSVAAYACALAVLLGHVFPVLLRFQGGKGVATAFGAFLAIDWRMALLCLLIVAVVVLLSRYVSLGSLTAAIACPFLCMWLEPGFVPYGVVMALIVIFKHRSNLMRLVRGEENKLNFHKRDRKGE